MPGLGSILSLDDFERAARSRLPRPVFAYVSGATEDNAAFRDNRAAFEEYGFVPRVLVDVSKRTAKTMLFGREYAAPFGIAPMGSRRSPPIAATWCSRAPHALRAFRW